MRNSPGILLLVGALSFGLIGFALLYNAFASLHDLFAQSYIKLDVQLPHSGHWSFAEEMIWTWRSGGKSFYVWQTEGKIESLPVVSEAIGRETIEGYFDKWLVAHGWEIGDRYRTNLCRSYLSKGDYWWDTENDDYLVYEDPSAPDYQPPASVCLTVQPTASESKMSFKVVLLTINPSLLTILKEEFEP